MTAPSFLTDEEEKQLIARFNAGETKKALTFAREIALLNHRIT